MSAVESRRLSPTTVWVALCAATAITTWVLSTDGMASRWALGLTFALVAWKALLVLRSFMELQEVSLGRRIVVELWAVLVPAGLCVALILT